MALTWSSSRQVIYYFLKTDGLSEMFKFPTIAFTTLVMVCLCSQSADAQLFRSRGVQSNYYAVPSTRVPSVSYAPSVKRPATPRPVTGYGANFHRNFVIRQEQLRTQRTGLPPRSRGNILWAR